VPLVVAAATRATGDFDRSHDETARQVFTTGPRLERCVEVDPFAEDASGYRAILDSLGASEDLFRERLANTESAGRFLHVFRRPNGLRFTCRPP
jgi:hypothetical protein